MTEGSDLGGEAISGPPGLSLQGPWSLVGSRVHPGARDFLWNFKMVTAVGILVGKPKCGLPPCPFLLIPHFHTLESPEPSLMSQKGSCKGEVARLAQLLQGLLFRSCGSFLAPWAPEAGCPFMRHRAMLSTAPIPSFSQVLPAQGRDAEQISGAVWGNAGGWWQGVSQPRKVVKQSSATPRCREYV